MNKLTVLIIIAAVSFGCARTLVSMKDECSSYGFKEGSDKYGECMMILSQRDIDRRQNISDSVGTLTGGPTQRPTTNLQPLPQLPDTPPPVKIPLYCTSNTFNGRTTTTCN
jgi:hypothetical protein